MTSHHTAENSRRRWPWALLLALLIFPALTLGDTVYLKDGSSLNGRVKGYAGDTLRFDAAFGVVKIPRDRISAIVFGDSAALPPGVAAGAAVPAAAEADSGDIVVTFKERGLSSKIKVTKKQDVEGHLDANTILQVLLVDGDTAWVYADTTTDKVIYQGPDRVYKNSIELRDIRVRVSAGVHAVSLVVFDRGEVDYAERFEDGPLHMEFAIGDLRVDPGSERRVNLGISKGKLKLGRPRFVRLD